MPWHLCSKAGKATQGVQSTPSVIRFSLIAIKSPNGPLFCFRTFSFREKITDTFRGFYSTSEGGEKGCSNGFRPDSTEPESTEPASTEQYYDVGSRP